jgi:hypothetical protein
MCEYGEGISSSKESSACLLYIPLPSGERCTANIVLAARFVARPSFATAPTTPPRFLKIRFRQ